ncbi:MAG: hypothetical protein V2J24_14455 [Pseudomonadales bacterium]|jgi:hypothetical protein|nr:hypothetical protein [Pseudomonadales bacterium]
MNTTGTGAVRGLVACALGLALLAGPAHTRAEAPETAGAPSTSASVAARELTPSGALLLPFRAMPLGEETGRARIEWVMQRHADELNPPDLHFSSKLRTRDESGHHNDFRLKHSGNLFHIPLAP